MGHKFNGPMFYSMSLLIMDSAPPPPIPKSMIKINIFIDEGRSIPIFINKLNTDNYSWIRS